MFRKKLPVLLFLGICLLTTTVSAQNPRKFFKAGEEFVNSKNYEDAIDQFTKAIELNPEYTDAYLARAQAFENLDKLQEAYEDYKRAFVFLPKEEFVAYSLGKISNELGEYEQALGYLNTATTLSRKYLPAYQEKVISLLELEDYKFAIKVSDTALALEDNAINYYYHGVVNERLNKPEAAESDYTKAISENRNFIDGLLALAKLRLQMNKLDLAMGHCNSILRIDNRNTDAYMIRSKIYVQNLDYPSAINDMSKNILIEPDNPDMYFQRGIYYQDFNQHTNAISDFTKVITMNDRDPEAYFKRARSYEEILNYVAAVKDYETIASLSEFDMQARKLLKEANERLYELNREEDKPEISLDEPILKDEIIIEIPGDKEEIVFKGIVADQSSLEFLRINGKDISFESKRNGFSFLTNVEVSGIDTITIEASDIYHNQETFAYL
ncbi:MAG: tetratricopeptide repeat protein, partial [Bacteroidales bacterium]